MDARETLEMALRAAHDDFVSNIAGVSLEEALDPAGGYRSVMGITKHVAAWSAVYHSFAFDTEPRHWDATDWPRGSREHIDPTVDYLGELLAWFELTYGEWHRSIGDGADPTERRPVHWGERMTLADIVLAVSQHWTYHAGEINAILAIQRGEAWEYTEEVEENHISTAGHRVRPGWMTDEQAARYEGERP